MRRKHYFLLGIVVSLFLLFIATSYYPGGSQHDINAIGFSWQHNYLSNLFDKTAVNGMDNPSRFWASAAVFVMCTSFALFFIDFSKKIPTRSAAHVIQYSGVGAMLFAFLITTIYHDMMIIISGILALLALFYIFIFVLKSRLRFLKLLSIISLLVFYGCSFIYYTRSYLDILPIFQKITLALITIWLLCLHYFAEKDDFVIKSDHLS